ncbi:hypothetical protein [Ferrovibrio sp.]|uniref:hypothetical protein n=1 Tax=Ferrovibrio sp. TaxID=1917215 RepID=UPI003D1266DC
METGVAAASAALEKALRRLDAALANRAVAYRALAEQHGQATLELRQTREALQATRVEADSLRERAALVDALREELAVHQAEAEAGTEAEAGAQAEMPALPAADNSEMLAALERENVSLKREREDLQNRLSAALAAQEQLRLAAEQIIPVQAVAADGSDAAALRAELDAARAAQAEAKAFEAGLLVRLDATMDRLRRSLESAGGTA